MILNYSRKTLNQSGDGHFSPVAGVTWVDNDGGGKDMWVLILDTARYKYPAHWIPFDGLWTSLCT